MLTLIACSSPIIWTVTVALVSGLIGFFMGAWWQSKPLTDAELRVLTSARRYSEMNDEDFGI